MTLQNDSYCGRHCKAGTWATEGEGEEHGESERGERLQITDQDGLECRLSPQISGSHTDFGGKQTYITILTITGP